MTESEWPQFYVPSRFSNYDINRFLRLVDPNGPIIYAELGQCWMWKGYRYKEGYGRFKIGSRVEFKSSRLSYEITYGPITHLVYIRHACDNPPCCNPGHLLKGTQQNNVDDMMERGRNTPTPGERNERAILNSYLVMWVRMVCIKGHKELGVGALSRQLGVDWSTINMILSDDKDKGNWQHLWVYQSRFEANPDSYIWKLPYEEWDKHLSK